MEYFPGKGSQLSYLGGHKSQTVRAFNSWIHNAIKPSVNFIKKLLNPIFNINSYYHQIIKLKKTGFKIIMAIKKETFCWYFKPYYTITFSNVNTRIVLCLSYVILSDHWHET